MEEKDLSKLERRKKNRFVLSLDDEDKELFLKKLEKEKVSAQKYLYQKVFADEIEQNRDYLELSYQLRKLGVTLNQYLKLIYIGQSVQDNQIIRILEEVQELLKGFKKGGKD